MATFTWIQKNISVLEIINNTINKSNNNNVGIENPLTESDWVTTTHTGNTTTHLGVRPLGNPKGKDFVTYEKKVLSEPVTSLKKGFVICIDNPYYNCETKGVVIGYELLGLSLHFEAYGMMQKNKPTYTFKDVEGGVKIVYTGAYNGFCSQDLMPVIEGPKDEDVVVTNITGFDKKARMTMESYKAFKKECRRYGNPKALGPTTLGQYIEEFIKISSELAQYRAELNELNKNPPLHEGTIQYVRSKKVKELEASASKELSFLTRTITERYGHYLTK